MSLYNMVNGMSAAVFWIAPMLDIPLNKVPRFRDCFVSDDGLIDIFTRVGTPNRGCGFGEDILENHPDFVRWEDDENDRTYASYYFNVPDRWREDFEIIMGENGRKISSDYRKQLEKIHGEKFVSKVFNYRGEEL